MKLLLLLILCITSTFGQNSVVVQLQQKLDAFHQQDNVFSARITLVKTDKAAVTPLRQRRAKLRADFLGSVENKKLLHDAHALHRTLDSQVPAADPPLTLDNLELEYQALLRLAK